MKENAIRNILGPSPMVTLPCWNLYSSNAGCFLEAWKLSMFLGCCYKQAVQNAQMHNAHNAQLLQRLILVLVYWYCGHVMCSNSRGRGEVALIDTSMHQALSILSEGTCLFSVLKHMPIKWCFMSKKINRQLFSYLLRVFYLPPVQSASLHCKKNCQRYAARS